MFSTPHTIPPVWLTEQQTLMLSQTFKSQASIKSSSWQSFLDSVYDTQLKFKVVWTRVHKRDDRYLMLVGYPIDETLPPPTLPPPGDDVEFDPNNDKVFNYFDYDFNLRIFILDSPGIYWLSNTNDPRVLDELIQLLDVPDRAWAANVILAKMLGKASLNDFEIRVDKAKQWWESEGKTGKAKQEWATYLEQVKPTLQWSIVGGYYKHTTPNGEKVP